MSYAWQNLMDYRGVCLGGGGGHPPAASVIAGGCAAPGVDQCRGKPSASPRNFFSSCPWPWYGQQWCFDWRVWGGGRAKAAQTMVHGSAILVLASRPSWQRSILEYGIINQCHFDAPHAPPRFLYPDFIYTGRVTHNRKLKDCLKATKVIL